MRRFILPILVYGVAALTFSNASAHHPKHWCEPGYKIVECIEYKETIRDVCRVVQDVKKVSKWVYSCKDDPFCIQRSGKSGLPCGCGKDGCPKCKGPYSRIQLVKKEVIEEVPITKCVVEKVAEVTPIKTYKKIRCTDPCPPGAAVVFDGDHPNAVAQKPVAPESPTNVLPASLKSPRKP